MKHLRHLLAPTESLLRVYSPRCCLAQRIRLQSYAPRPNLRTVAQATAVPPARRDRLAEFVKDEDIDTAWVQVKQPDGSLGEAQLLRDLVRSIDRRNQVVVQRSKPGQRENAVVEVCDKLDLIKSLRAREESARQHALSQKDHKPKQIEMNWAIGGNDLELKLKQMEQFLNKGKKVEILLAAKKRQRKASEEEGEEVLKKLRQRISEVGAKEMKMEGGLLRQAIMTVKKLTE